MRTLIIKLIKAYKYVISPMLGDNCRFHPSCSTYTMEAIRVHGVLKGLFLGVRRVIKCNPLHEGGLDPVPGSTDQPSEVATNS